MLKVYKKYLAAALIVEKLASEFNQQEINLKEKLHSFWEKQEINTTIQMCFMSLSESDGFDNYLTLINLSIEPGIYEIQQDRWFQKTLITEDVICLNIVQKYYGNI